MAKELGVKKLARLQPAMPPVPSAHAARAEWKSHLRAQDTPRHRTECEQMAPTLL
jgi:hypothetical protein